jgi:hypothetical protein
MSQYISEHWNGDRGLIQLTNMLSSAAQAAARGEATSNEKQEIVKFLNRGGWKEKDVQRMLTMACSLLESGATLLVLATLQNMKTIAVALLALAASWSRTPSYSQMREPRAKKVATKLIAVEPIRIRSASVTTRI